MLDHRSVDDVACRARCAVHAPPAAPQAQLLQRCKERIDTWQAKCDALVDQHDRNLYAFTGASPA